MLKTSGELELFKIQWIVVQMPPLYIVAAAAVLVVVISTPLTVGVMI